jgi:hypothetical protein
MEAVKWGTDYLLRTFKDNGANNVTVVYQVCHPALLQGVWGQGPPPPLR